VKSIKGDSPRLGKMRTHILMLFAFLLYALCVASEEKGTSAEEGSDSGKDKSEDKGKDKDEGKEGGKSDGGKGSSKDEKKITICGGSCIGSGMGEKPEEGKGTQGEKTPSSEATSTAS
jgi:hypothetical protein